MVIESIDRYGVVIVKFSDKLFIPEDPSRLKEQEFKVKGKKL